LNKLNGECLETDVGVPKDEFTWAKHALLNWLKIRCRSKDTVFAWLRIFYVYGPNQRSGSLIPTILSHLREGRLPDLRTPKNSNDFIYVDDVAEAFYKSVERNIPSGIYNLGSGKSTPVIEVCKIAEKIVRNTGDLTANLACHTVGKPSDVNFWADCHQSNELLGWKASTSLYDGISKTWNSID
jgi:nucleoside-diphosphate-sugar epimerase